MIKIVKKEKVNIVCDPYFMIKFNYMIGDANGHTSEKVDISRSNPFLERFVTLVNSLTSTKGTWGIVFDESNLEKHFNEGQISLDEYNFLLRTMYGERDPDVSMSEKDEEFADEFYQGVRGETEYSFLVFQSLDLYYYNEHGKKCRTEIV